MIKILEFKYKDKKYVVYLNDGKVLFGFYKNNILITDLNDFDKSLLTTTYNYIVGEKENIIPLSIFIYKGNIVKPYYNVKNGLYSIDCNNIYVKRTLNYLLNNQSGVVYENNDKIVPRKRFKILMRIGSIVTTVVISASIILSTLPIVPNNQVLFNVDYEIDSLYKNKEPIEKEVDIEFILKNLYNNPNLTDEEKEFLSNCVNEIEENKYYINFDQLNRNIQELRINYNSSFKDEMHILYPIAGSYTYIGENRNVIELYGEFMNNYSDDFSNCSKATLIHEFNHLMNSRNRLLSIPGKPGNVLEDFYLYIGVDSSQLEEMVNELFAREYFADYTDQLVDDQGYYWLMPAMYALAEIIEPDVLRTYKFDSDNYYITNYLSELGVPQKEIFDLYKSLDIVFELYNLSSSPKATVQDKKAYKDNMYNIYRIIDMCYEYKYNRQMINDLNMLLYFYNTGYVDESFNKNVRDILGVDEIYSVTPKGYVSSTYKAKNPYVKVYTNEEKTDEIEITDDIRYIVNIMNKL